MKLEVVRPPKFQPGHVAAAITAYLEGSVRRMDETVLSEAMTRFRRSTQKQLMKPNDSRKGYESNSLFIKPCARQARFQYDGVEREGLKARTFLKFMLGDAVELEIMMLAKLAGIDLGWNNEDLTVNGRDGKNIPVHPDGLLHVAGTNYNVEVKSTDSRTFDRWMDGGGPSNDWGYLTQASVEIAAWREAGVDVSATNFIAVSTGSRIGSIADWTIPYDQSLVDAWHDRRALVHAKELPPIPYQTEAETEYVAGRNPDKLATAAANGIPCAPREGAKGIYGWDIPTGRQILPTACSYCDFKAHCYPTAVMELQGDRPVWVVPGKTGGAVAMQVSHPKEDDTVTALSAQKGPDAGTPTDLHPMACSGPEAWSNWVDEMTLLHVPEWNNAKRTMRLNSAAYDQLSAEDRSAFAHSVEDRVRQNAMGMTKKKGRKK